MNRTLRKLLLVSVAVFVVIVSAGFAAVEMRWTRTFGAPYPMIGATKDPAVVARGRYLVYGPGACVYCHVPKEEWPKLDAGATPPLSGNHVFRLPFGDFYSPNLTPDRETGIGARDDGELARVLRYGVRADGRAAFPLMEFYGLSDDDLRAIVSFLRSQPAVRQDVPDHQLSVLGKALMAFAIAPPERALRPPASSPEGPSVQRGEYIANSVSLCVSCHTDRSRRDGSYVGPKFAGGQKLDVADNPTKVLVPPNLTPDPGTSPIGVWTEDMFLTRFRQGPILKETIMPWGAYSRMTDDDLRSVYRYLRSLPPVVHETGPVAQEKE
jgi:mono/diheme cytochrome c family protein